MTDMHMYKIILIAIFILSTSAQSNLFSDVSKSVVAIIAINSQNNTNNGTGFFIDGSGDVITNLHVIHDVGDVRSIKIITEDGVTYEAKDHLADDIRGDLFCFSVNNISPQLIFPVRLNTNTSKQNISEEISIIGYPEGLENFVEAINNGEISSIEDTNEYGEVIRIDVSISPGNSGSPVFNMNREVIGVATQGLVRGQKANFAISSKQVSKLIRGISSSSHKTPISQWKFTQEEKFYATGIHLYREGKYDEAIGAFDKAIKINPKYANAWNSKGIALYYKGNYDEAITALDKAIELDPKNASPIWINKGNFSSNQGDDEQALKAFDKATELEPLNADAWNGKGQVLIDLGKYDDAIKAFNNATKINPRYADAWGNKCVALINLKKYDEAIIAINKSIEFCQGNKLCSAQALINKGEALYCLGKYDESIRTYNNTIELDPKSVYAEIAWVRKGNAIDFLGNHDEAIRAYDKALELNPNNTVAVAAWICKGIALDENGKYKEAVKAYDNAIKIEPLNADAWTYKGLDLDFNLDNHDEALKAYNKAIEINISRSSDIIPEPENGLAKGIFIKTLDKAIDNNQSQANAWIGRALILDRLGRLDAAAAAYDKAIEFDPQNADVWNAKGVFLSNLERYNDSIYYYDEAIKLNSTNPIYLKNRDNTLRSLSRITKSKATPTTDSTYKWTVIKKAMQKAIKSVFSLIQTMQHSTHLPSSR